MIVRPLFENIGDVYENRIPFETKGHWGYIDTLGNIKVQAQYESASNFQSSIAVVKDGKKYYWLDTAGNKLNEQEIDYAYELGNKRWAGVKSDTAFALLDYLGKALTPFQYGQINKFSDGLAVFTKDNHWGYMDTSGNHAISNIFLLAWDFKNGVARYSLGRGIGFINTKGKAFHESLFPDVRDYSEGLAKVQTVTR